MSDLSTTFGSWKDRLTYIVAEAQLLVIGLVFSIGALFFFFKPELPGIPPIANGWLFSLLFFGPPLLAIFVMGARRLRDRHDVTVHHINGVTDTREKYYVPPEMWENKTVDGPSPFPVNDGDAYEVREFEELEDVDELRVRGCYMSQMPDSKLVTVKTMLEDVHGDLIDTYLAHNRLRARISKMGLQIQADVINEEAEADERGLMNPKTSVKKRWDDAEKDANRNGADDIEDVNKYVEDYATEHGIETTGGPPATPEQAADAATDGGTDR